MRTLPKLLGPCVTPGMAPGAWRALKPEALARRVEVLAGVPSASATYGLRHVPSPRDELLA
eukprot:2819297-Prorocentrum_lima.AAC.1